MEIPQQQLESPSPVYAGFWIRVLANLIDHIILLLVISLPLSMLYGFEAYWAGEKIIHGFWDVVGFIAPVVLTIWFWLRFLGTPGKMLCRLQVVDAKTLSALSLKQSIIRYLGYVPATLVLLIGILWVAFDRRKQGWHDKLAGSVVIRVARAQKHTA
ncbi:MAG: RDD family protein [Porticoccaceae bacterium]